MTIKISSTQQGWETRSENKMQEIIKKIPGCKLWNKSTHLSRKFVKKENKNCKLIAIHDIIWNLTILLVNDFFLLSGFMGVRAFDRKTRTPEELSKLFHVSTAKAGGKKNKKED